MVISKDHRGRTRNLEAVIVSRHPATVQWLLKHHPQFNGVPVLPSANPADVLGKVIVGNVPLHLARCAALVLAIEFTGSAPRGAEFTVEDMEREGATLEPYTVRWGVPEVSKSYVNAVRNRWFPHQNIKEAEFDED